MDKNLVKLIPYTKPYKSHIVWNVTYNILYALFSTLSLITIYPLLEVLFSENEQVTTRPIYTDIYNIGDYLKDSLFFHMSDLTRVHGPQYALLLTVGLVITTFLLKNLFNYLASFHIMMLKNGVLRDLRKKMYEKIISLPIPYYSEKRKGDVMSRMLGDVNEVQNSFFAILELIVKEPMTIAFAIIAMFNISVKLTLFVFIFIPISGFIISRIGKSLKSKSIRAQEERGYFISLVEESLSGLKVVKSYNSENAFKTKFNTSINRLFKLSNSIGNKNNLASPMSEF